MLYERGGQTEGQKGRRMRKEGKETASEAREQGPFVHFSVLYISIMVR